ncbi:P-loop NTPase fold protein [Saccharococcus caldoxylosilyticus]|uniref:P-loop NTPase fold protein n=1 Tax=Saccharococcus caldoxylosilyticus TaxID=81408 RepID=UPI001FCC6E80|nr:P-loop NTPase fold protein [Parageobacillus caldoxylosilyticus]BDG36478.1 hypothetical protein PcaKH15_23840 [Parageobacillus caldoxylosilyticus]BDG40266.1 hypothetical protein PcaKH16_24050 [Parageobacillus caldoxylosilyticus]BDG44016.1 hypothetical protein PcaKH35_23610 [Parageobacillus caldoxylosilyticus]
MQSNIEIVKDYVERPRTNYALMISGDWGSGKTYFLKNYVFPELIAMNKRPVYITLNGLSTIEELSKQIYLETTLFRNEKIKKAMDSKALKYVTQFTKVIHNTATMLNLAGNIENSIDFDELIDIEDNVILCFDDLERCRIEITEILGYINNFVEHDGIKTIIIANEKEIKDTNMEQHKELKMLTAIESLKAEKKELSKDEISKKLASLFTEQKHYDVIKEKVIGKTLFYVPDIPSIIDDIIKEYNESKTESYYAFLKENKDDILYIFNLSERRNIRVLKHALSDFTKVHQTLYAQLEESKYKKELITKYFIPALISSIEYRTGTLNYKFLTETPTTRISTSYLTLSGQVDEFQIFSKYLKGYSKKELYFSQFINTYIASSILKEDHLINEARDFIRDLEKRDNEVEYKTSIEKLIYEFLELENDEFEKYVDDVLGKVTEGHYPLNYYVKIFYYMEFFSKNSLLNKNISEITNLFKKGIETAKDDTLADERFHLFHIDEINKSPDLKHIEEAVEKRRKFLTDSHLKDSVTTIMNLLPDNVDEFIRQYREFSSGKTLRAIMQYIDIEKFASQITSLSNKDITSIMRLFESIYDFPNFYKDDYKYILELADSLEKKLNTKQSVSRFILKLFVEKLKGIASRLES